MLEAPVGGLVSRLAVPTVASMLVTNLYNAGDAWFVSRLGTSASGAVGIVFALMAVFQAFGFLFGHGAGSNISRRLGAGDVAGARVFAATSFFSALGTGAAVSALGLVFLEPLARAFGSTDTILPYAKQYMRWILVSGPLFTASCVMNNILRYEGRAALAMVGLLSGSMINLALDPILMFGLGLGVSGTGLATAIAQTAGFTILLSMFRGGRTASVFRIRLVSLRRRVAGSIVAIGSPSLLRNACGAVAPVLLNHQAAAWGDAAIAAMSIVGRVGFLVAAVSIGIGQGFQPVAGFNWGAGRADRV
ncbi:MAG: MATE family efflux transporter, partial [Kiritimatiellae bacterium]|nr:MATE family efflux transporter [Kiritimatiellia bacterium]